MKFLRNLPTSEPSTLSDLIQVRSGQVISMALSRSDTCHMTLLAFSKGESVSEESYFGDTLYYVVEGEMDLTMQEHVYKLQTGMCMAVPAGILHAVESVSDFKVLQLTLES